MLCLPTTNTPSSCPATRSTTSSCDQCTTRPPTNRARRRTPVCSKLSRREPISSDTRTENHSQLTISQTSTSKSRENKEKRTTSLFLPEPRLERSTTILNSEDHSELLNEWWYPTMVPMDYLLCACFKWWGFNSLLQYQCIMIFK
jgi:hypothetical protein